MKLLQPRTRAFLSYFARAYPGRTTAMVGLLVLSGLFEGMSVMTLMPMLETAATSSTGAEASAVGRFIHGMLRELSIEPSLYALVGVVVLGITLKATVLWLAMRQIGFTTARVTLDLRLELVRAVLRARWSYYGQQLVGTFANSISREAVRSSMAYREACAMFSGVIQVLTYLMVSALISWKITIVALSTGAVLIWGLKSFVAMSRAAGEDNMRLTRSLAARLVEALHGIKSIKVMAREDLVWPLLESEAEGLNRADRRTVIASETLKLAQEPIVTLIMGISLITLLTVTGRSFSAVVVLAFVFYRLMTSMNTIQTQYQYMANGESMFWSLRNQIDEARAVAEDHPGTIPPTHLDEAIELRNVSFAYGDLQVLQNLSLRIPARRITALIGGSGSGKTTILDLITGLHRPREGEVYVDGTPLRELDLRAWRQLIGYVPQDVFLFHDTVRRNITLGDSSISDDRVVQALKDAGAWEFVARDTAGIDAMVSPQGSSLSGGQKQRLAIARALVKDPLLLVLDEATTGLDMATEAAVLETLRALRGRVTILAVSHQSALRQTADVVIELGAQGVKRVDPRPLVTEIA